MANNNTEIEIQVKITEEDFNNLKEYMNKKAKFIKTTYQEDDYYTPIHRNFVEPKYPFEWIRIGKRGDRVMLTYKHYYPENAEVNTHCDEFEVEINSKEQMNKIFTALDLKKLITVKKTRNTYEYNDELEIALDIVDELGYYIEIETIKDFGSVESSVERLHQFAEEFNIDLSNRDNRGYPARLLEKKGLTK